MTAATSAVASGSPAHSRTSSPTRVRMPLEAGSQVGDQDLVGGERLEARDVYAATVLQSDDRVRRAGVTALRLGSSELVSEARAAREGERAAAMSSRSAPSTPGSPDQRASASGSSPDSSPPRRSVRARRSIAGEAVHPQPAKQPLLALGSSEAGRPRLCRPPPSPPSEALASVDRHPVLALEPTSSRPACRA